MKILIKNKNIQQQPRSHTLSNSHWLARCISSSHDLSGRSSKLAVTHCPFCNELLSSVFIDPAAAIDIAARATDSLGTTLLLAPPIGRSPRPGPWEGATSVSPDGLLVPDLPSSPSPFSGSARCCEEVASPSYRSPCSFPAVCWRGRLSGPVSLTHSNCEARFKFRNIAQ